MGAFCNVTEGLWIDGETVNPDVDGMLQQKSARLASFREKATIFLNV